MNINTDIFKIQSNNVMPSRGKILISEPFLHDVTFGRSVVLLVDHTEEGSMGLIINKPLPLMLNDIIFRYTKEVLSELTLCFICILYTKYPEPFRSTMDYISTEISMLSRNTFYKETL